VVFPIGEKQDMIWKNRSVNSNILKRKNAWQIWSYNDRGGRENWKMKEVAKRR
jgi:hypothetical protein